MKNKNRLYSMFLAVVMILSIIPTAAFASSVPITDISTGITESEGEVIPPVEPPVVEEEPPTGNGEEEDEVSPIVDTTVNVKYTAPDVGAVVNTLKASITTQPRISEYKDIKWSDIPTEFKIDGSMVVTMVNVETGKTITNKVNYVVKTTNMNLSETVVPTIKADDRNNRDENTLLSYMNKNRNLIADVSNIDYVNAIGEAPRITLPEFVKGADFIYEPFGGKTYTLTQEFEGVAYTKTLLVESLIPPAPEVIFDKINMTLSSRSGPIEYSTDKVNYTAINGSFSVNNIYQETTYYIRTPSTDYTSASAIRTIIVPAPGNRYTEAPNVNVDSGSMKIYVNGYGDRRIQYSLDRSKWINGSNDMSFQSSWYNNYVYFRFPATVDYFESNIASLYIPGEQEKPTGRLELESTSYSVTVLNVEDFRLCEFSINGGSSWRRPSNGEMRWDNLDSNKSYTVWVRYYSDNDYLPSDHLSATITTQKSISDKELDVKEVINGTESHINMDIYVKSVYSSSTATGTITSTMLKKLVSTVKEADKNKDVSVVLRVGIDRDDYSKDISKTVLNIDASSLTNISKYADLKIIFTNDFFDMEFNSFPKSGTMKLSVEEVDSVTGSKYDGVRDHIKNQEPVYKVTVTDNPTVKYTTKYKLSNNESLDSINIYYVDTNGKESKLSTRYNPSTESTIFNAETDNYIIIGKSSGKTASSQFGDVTGSWALKYISYCTDKKIFNGVTSTEFAPSMNVSRSMMITLLARLSGTNTTIPVLFNAFEDVNGSEWFGPSVQWAVNNKIINTDQKVFGANEGMTREEVARVIYNYLNNKSGNTLKASTTTNYTDRGSFKDWSIVAIDYLAQEEIMMGTSGNTFNHSGFITRAEMATIMYRLSV